MEWLSSVPAYFWIFAIGLIVVLVTFICIFIVKVIQGKLEINSKWGSVSSNKSEKKITEMNWNAYKKDFTASNLYRVIYDKLPLIRQVKWAAYLEEIKTMGVGDNYILQEDAQHYYQCLGNIIYSGNGIKSYLSILQNAVIDKQFKEITTERDREKYADTILAYLFERGTVFRQCLLIHCITDGWDTEAESNYERAVTSNN